MTEFERESLQRQDLKKAEELAKATTSYEKVKEGCDQLAVDTQPIGDRDEWKLVGDDAVRKAMHSKGDWVKEMRKIQEEFTRYKTLISI